MRRIWLFPFIPLVVPFTAYSSLPPLSLTLYIQNTETLENWAIEIDLSEELVFSSSISTISFQVDGERVGDEGDLYFGFGDGSTYITAVVDFDGIFLSSFYVHRVFNRHYAE